MCCKSVCMFFFTGCTFHWSFWSDVDWTCCKSVCMFFLLVAHSTGHFDQMLTGCAVNQCVSCILLASLLYSHMLLCVRLLCHNYRNIVAIFFFCGFLCFLYSKKENLLLKTISFVFRVVWSTVLSECDCLPIPVSDAVYSSFFPWHNRPQCKLCHALKLHGDSENKCCLPSEAYMHHDRT